MLTDALQAETSKLLEVHGIGAGKPPANPAAAEVFRDFCSRPETTPVGLEVQNRFYPGRGLLEVDWQKPVHGILLDFKGDSMQIGMIIERLEVTGDWLSFFKAAFIRRGQRKRRKAEALYSNY